VGTGHGADGAARPAFDLDRGRIALGDERHLLVPAAALLAVCHAAGERAARDLGRAVGELSGRRLAAGRAGRPDAGFTEAIDALGAELAWLGLGALVAERWGELLVLRIDGAPTGADDVDPLVSGVVEGAIEAWTGRTAHAVVVERAADRLRVLVGGPRSVGTAQALAQAGADLHAIVRRLHDGAEHPAQDPT
jgi:hypothetical protein